MAHQKTKRPRFVSSAQQLANVEPKHQRFTTWSQEHGVEINAVLPQSLHGRGLGLVATRQISKGERILFVPEEAMFKPDFSTLRQKSLERVSSQAKLTISALLRFAAKSSKLQVWLDTWPTISDFEACMPIYWSNTVTECLPSSVHRAVKRQMDDYEKDWKACRKAAHDAGHNEALFKYYWMIVNSRSFHWAPPKGGAGYMIMCPFIDYINHGPSGSGCDVFQRSDGYEVLAERSYDQGEEMLISYGAHVNEKLLVHYGFILPYSVGQPSIDDEVRIDDQIMLLLPDVVKERLSDLGYLGPFALVPNVDDGSTCDWEPCFKTQVAIRATLLTCNEWEYFAGCGEDLGGDKSSAVLEVLSKALQPLQVLAEQRSNADLGQCPDQMTSEHFNAANDIISSRWQQIERAIEHFLNRSE